VIEDRVKTPLPERGPDETHFLADEYGFEIHPFKGRVSAWASDVALAASDRALLLVETGQDSAYYFPPEDVRVDLLRESPLRTYCPFRGNATYWSLEDGQPDIAWCYQNPIHDARRIRGYFSFDVSKLDELRVESGRLPPHAPPRYANPLVDWALSRAPEARSVVELIEQFTDAAEEGGIILWRVWLAVPTLHPQLFSMSYTWQRPEPGDPEGSGGTVERTIHHGLLQRESFLDSPARLIFEGAGGVRQRLEGDDPELDFPVVRDHWRAGATDYVAKPVTFSDGQINALSLTTRTPGGFTTRDLGFLYEVLPVFSRLLEVHAERRKSVSLLQTYLGKQTGERVLNGLVRRGDRSRIHAVIWFSDLRDSTHLAESLPADEYLDTLNEFYDCVAQPILRSGGEILRFIGDAALAIFPIDSLAADSDGEKVACFAALGAADEARRNVSAANAARAQRGAPPLGYGLGLHLGELTYGNIGTAERLEFTVIGPAANEAARLQDLCKRLGHSVLVSQLFLDQLGDDPAAARFRSAGAHGLRGVQSAMTVYALCAPTAFSQ